MKNLVTLFLLMVFIVIPASAEETGLTLRITIKGVDLQQGNIRVALFEKKENFLTEKMLQGKVVKAKRGSVDVTFNNLDAKVYSVALFQDLNGNEILDKNFLGYPREPYGFSKNVYRLFGPATFNQASFKLDKDKHLEIKLR